MDLQTFGVDVLEDAASYFERMPKISVKAQTIAINQIATRGGLKLLRDDVQAEVAFPAGYLKSNNRLYVSDKATNSKPEAVISARQRPTSLARFAQGAVSATGDRKGGVSVMVKPGTSRQMPKAFLMRLRAGASLTADNYNVGLAVRLKPGDRILNKRKQSPVQLGHNLYLLYGPSVDQVFRSVAVDDSEIIADMTRDEFFRQFTRLSSE